MASLYPRNDWYYAQFFDPERKPTRKQIALKTKRRREAERLCAKLEADVERGQFDPWDPKPCTAAHDLSVLGSAVATFLDSRANLSPHTVRRYSSVLGGLVSHLGPAVSVQSLTVRHVSSYLDATSTKPVTKHSYRRAMRTFFRWLVERDAIAEDVTGALRLERVPQKFPRFLTPDDVAAVCEAIERSANRKHVAADTSRWLLPIIKANVYLGLRAGEVVNARWDDLDLVHGTLTVVNRDGFTTKGGSERVLPLCDPVTDIFGTLERRCDWLFPNHGGSQLHRAYLSRRFKHFARVAGLTEEINFHATRHTSASWLAQRGASVEAIRRYMGHSSIAVTQRYMHLSRDGFSDQILRAFSDAGSPRTPWPAVTRPE